MSTEGRPSVAFLLTMPLLAIAIGTLGWIPLFITAGLAMGNATNAQIAAALASAGAAAVIGLSLTILGLTRRRLAVQAVSMVALGVNAVLAVVVLVLAVKIRW
jgi:hypothetical protein